MYRGIVHTVPTLGTASSGIDSNAPMVAMDFGGVCGEDGGADGCGDDVSCFKGLAYAGAISVNSPISNHPSKTLAEPEF